MKDFLDVTEMKENTGQATTALVGLETQLDETKTGNDPIKTAQAAATFSAVITNLVGW